MDNPANSDEGFVGWVRNSNGAVALLVRVWLVEGDVVSGRPVTGPTRFIKDLVCGRGFVIGVGREVIRCGEDADVLGPSGVSS